MKKNDVLLIAVILSVAGVLYMYSYYNQGRGADYVEITIDGKKYSSYSLDEDREIVIHEGEDYNKLVIKDKRIYMEEANCRDEYCVNQGVKCKNGDTIICLPHRLAVSVKKSGSKNVDVIAK